MISQETLEKVKKMLIEEKTKILRKLQKNMQEVDSSRDRQGVGDEIDSAVAMEMENLANALSSMEMARLRQIEDALRRIEEGTYGYCKVCGEPIEEGRLLAKPFATMCISCKEAEERKRF